MQTSTLPRTDQVWDWLGQIPDPEIPVISLTDLGIIRDVAWDDDTLVVTVTPTYTGCPATSIISLDIERALRDRGVEKIRLERQLSPPWTTDWISREGREKLHDNGIVPPIDGTAADGRLTGRVARLCGTIGPDHRMPPLRVKANGKSKSVRFDALQGELPLQGLS